MHPFCPFWIETPIGFLIFGFEDPDRFAVAVLDEIRTGTALIYSLGVNASFDGHFGLSHKFRELRIVWKNGKFCLEVKHS